MPKYIPAVYDEVNPQFIALPQGSTVDPASIPEFESKNKSYFQSNGFIGVFNNSGIVNFATGTISNSADITLTTNNTVNLPANKKYCIDAILTLSVQGGPATSFSFAGTNLVINTTQTKSFSGTGNLFISGMLVTNSIPGTLQLLVTNVSGASVTITNQSLVRIFEI